MKYEEPYIEIVRFEFKNNVLTASYNNGNGNENTLATNDVVGGDDGEVDFWV